MLFAYWKCAWVVSDVLQMGYKHDLESGYVEEYGDVEEWF
jgi:hypothetical protein